MYRGTGHFDTPLEFFTLEFEKISIYFVDIRHFMSSTNDTFAHHGAQFRSVLNENATWGGGQSMLLMNIICCSRWGFYCLFIVLVNTHIVFFLSWTSLERFYISDIIFRRQWINSAKNGCQMELETHATSKQFDF